MRIAADHDVDAAQLRDDLPVIVVADVAHHDDLVDAVGFQTIDLALRGDGFVLEGRIRVRARRGFGLHGDRQADHADPLAATLEHDRGANRVRRTGRAQGRAGAEAHVRAEYRGPAVTGMQLIEKSFQSAVALVELVVAEREGVEADGVHQRGIGLADLSGPIEVERAGQGVTGVQLQHVRLALGQQAHRARHPREAGGGHGHIAALVASAGFQQQFTIRADRNFKHRHQAPEAGSSGHG